MPVPITIRSTAGDNKWAASVLALRRATARSKWGSRYTPNDPYDFDEISSTRSSASRSAARIESSWCMPRAMAFTKRALDRVNGSFGRQASVDELTRRPADPKTGRPLNYPIPARMCRSMRRAATVCACWQPALPIELRRQESGRRRLTIPGSISCICRPSRAQRDHHRRAEELCRPGCFRESARTFCRRRHDGAPQ